MQHEVDAEHRWRVAKWIGLSLLLLMALLVLYALSPGPVITVWSNCEFLDREWIAAALSALYWPLEEAYNRSETVERFYDWYFEFWEFD